MIQIGAGPIGDAFVASTFMDLKVRNHWHVHVLCPRCLRESTHTIKTKDRAKTCVGRGRCGHRYFFLPPGGLRWD